ncbi:hypothetical protein GH810_10055 [Acetobacterium paludosum]|uniref:Flagellar hook capping protein n=1 Tax=Acetobacterium paludosum TaxID=52693 RepID=A0A923KSR6_9FIRM|nr:flagellar hook capping FlgD N-terminal domain-containing protein [Acetobacterium paludosum]MBC3888652.1 hypothetical protein [Acetobacterium paludosum]
MAIDAVSASASTASTTSTSKNSTLSMNDFLQLMVAQLKNQDMNNAADTSQFSSQMAQYSMVQALSDLSKQSTTSYSVGLIGKEVCLKTTENGTTNYITGTVQGVNLQSGDAQIVVGGVTYPATSIVEVAQAAATTPATTPATK